MPNWTVKDLLDHVQELVGEPVGAYYNISSRLRQMNQAQREMVQDTRALTETTTLTVAASQEEFYLPDDFLTYAKEQPYFTDSADNVSKLQVVDVDWMDQLSEGWRRNDITYAATPRYIVMTGPQRFQLYPASTAGGTLSIPYVVDPQELNDFGDQVFNGSTNMNRYSLGLAYKVAAMYMMPRAPQLAQQYLSMYNTEMRKMRHDVRSNPQHAQTIRPRGYPRRTYSNGDYR